MKSFTAAGFGLLLVCVLGRTALGRQSPAAPRKGGNPEAAKVASPVMYSADSVAAGRRVYIRLCQNCHGSSGKGDGPGAAASASQPADLTDTTWEYGSSDGEIFAVIHDGTSMDMGSYAQRISDADIWNVVNFIRSLGPDRR